jgi:L-aminopeptidase/D-esterase-like protein
MVLLPPGFACGHWTDPVGLTGCTAVLAPPGAVGSGELRGGGPGTRESDLLSPATSTAGPQAVLLTGGSAFGLAAADGVVRFLERAGRGHPTPAGRVPLVSAAVVFDLMLGDAAARPGPDAGDAAAAAAIAGGEVPRGAVGAGTGCTVGKLLGAEGWTHGGFGAAALTVGAATVCALAAVNAIGDVLAADGSVLAGAWRPGEGFVRAVDLIRAGAGAPIPAERANTTLVCVCTDARLTKLQAFLVARAANAGVARAVSPSATSFDGDMTFCLAGGEAAVDADPAAVAVVAAEAATLAIRDGVQQSAGVPGAPSAAARRAEASSQASPGVRRPSRPPPRTRR